MDIMSRTLQQFLKGLDEAEIIAHQRDYERYIDEDKRQEFMAMITKPLKH